MSDVIDGWSCEDHKDRSECPDALLSYSEKVDEYGVIVLGTSAINIIKHCPWCWKKLPESKRDRWFNELEKLWFEDILFNDSIPDKYKTNEWYS